MKKKFFTILAIAALATAHVAKADKVITTISVPGSAKSVTTEGHTTRVDCDPIGPECYSSTTTTESGYLSIGDKVEISVTAADGDVFYIVGGYIDMTIEEEDDGSSVHYITLSPEWND